MRITRHPQSFGQALWCLAHTLWIGSTFMVATTGKHLIMPSFCSTMFFEIMRISALETLMCPTVSAWYLSYCESAKVLWRLTVLSLMLQEL